MRNITVKLEDCLCGLFEGIEFGSNINQLTIAVVSLSSEDDENIKISDGYSKIGRLRNPITGESVRFIGFGVPVNSKSATVMSSDQIIKFILDTIFEKASDPDIRIPKDFDYKLFLETLRKGVLACDNR